MVVILSFGIGLVASAFSALVGGAAGLVMVPLLLLIGVPPYTAVSTPKLGAVGISIGSLSKFYGKKYIRRSLVPAFIILAVLSGIIGAQALLKTPEYIVEKVVIILLVISLIALWSKKDMGVVGFEASRLRRATGYVMYFLSETLRAAFGSGFGMLTGSVLTYFFGLTMLESTATKRLPGFVVTVVALATFLFQGVIDIRIGLALFFGSLFGSYVGTHYAIKMGDRWVKYLFTVFAICMCVALLIF